MKHRTIVKSGLLTLALSLGLAHVDAQAQEFNSFYITPKLIYTHQMGDMAGGSWSYGPLGRAALGGSATDNNFGLGLSVGTDISYSSAFPVRVEAEYAYRGKAKFDNGSDVVPLYNDYARQSFEVTGHSLMFNAFYDFNTGTGFTPYLGGGIGMSYLNADYWVAADEYSGHATSDNWNFAWNVGGGVAYQFSDNMALDLGYRYMDLGSADCGDKNILMNGRSFNANASVDYTAHEVTLGLRFSGF